MSLSNVFTPDQHRMFTDLGWEMHWDLVGQVYVRLCYESSDRWVVIRPDGIPCVITTSNINEALGTY